MPRVVLKSNSQYGPRDPQSQEARSSWEPSSDSKSYGEICSNTVDHRISGVPLSAVEPQNTTRENKVKRLIEQFEILKHKESFFQDFSQTQKINKFSKESKDSIADLNNTEIFELFENSSKQECPDCNLYWERGIINCSCGRNMKSTRSPTEFDQNNRDVTSIPGYVIKKNSSRGVKHGPSEGQKMYYQARQMLKKARQEKHGRHPTILSLWYAEEDYIKSLSAIRVIELHIRLDDWIDLETHIYKATRAERIQIGFLLQILKEELMFHSIKDPTLLKRKENANDCMTSTWQQPNKNTETFLAVNKQDSETGNNLTAMKTLTTSLTRTQVGDSTDSRGETCRHLLQARGPTCKQLRHRRQRGTNPSGRRAIGILSTLQVLTMGDFFLRGRTVFGCLEKNLQPTDGRCAQYTHNYSTCRVAQHDHISPREHAWLKDCTSLCPQNNCHPRVMSRSLPHLTMTTSSSSLSPISSTSPIFSDGLTFAHRPYDSRPLFFLKKKKPCDVPRQSGGSTQIPPLTNVSPMHGCTVRGKTMTSFLAVEGLS